jgi:hypothetical protein
MGCGQSKMEEEYAVRHCRVRSELLALAIRQRYTLADAHHAYAESLRAVGALLHDFLRGVQSLPPPPPEPALRLPQQRKGDGLPAASPPPAMASSSAAAAAPPVAKQVRIAPDDGHIQFSDGDSDSEDGHIKFHSDEEPDPARRRPEVVRSTGAPGPPPPQMGQPYASGGGYAPPPYGPGYGYGYATGPGPGPGPDYGGIGMNGGGGYEPGHGVMYGQSYGGSGSGGGYDDQGYGGMGSGGGAGGYDQSYAGIGGYGQSFFNISYARSQPPPPSVSHEQRLEATNARVHYYSGNGEQQPPPRGYGGGYSYPPQSSRSYNQYAYGGYYGGGSAPAPPADIPSSSGEPAAVPPPPSPPRVSTWEFLDPFGTYESYYEQPTATAAPYSPGRSLKDVREEEGIPDLEDEDMEVVKEAYGDEKHPVKGYMGNGKAAKGEGRSSTGDELPRKSKSSEASGSGSSLEHDVHVVEKSVVGEQVRHSEPRQHVAGLPPTGSEKLYIDDTEVVVEIRTQFECASQSAGEVSKMLEVGKMPYYQKGSGFKGW